MTDLEPARPPPPDPGRAAGPSPASGRASRHGFGPRIELAIWATTVLAAAAIQVQSARHARFNGDEATHYREARAVALGHGWPSAGIPITGSEARTPGPAFHLIGALPLLLHDDPAAANAFVALAALAATVAVAAALRRSGHARLSTIYVVLGAFSPWLHLGGNRLWGGSLLLVVAPPWAVLLHRTLARPGSRAVAPLVALSLASVQLHLSTAILLLAAALAIAWTWHTDRRPPSAPWGLAGAALGAATYLPYLRGELASGFANTRAIARHAPGGEHGWVEALVPALQLPVLGSLDVAYWLSRGYWNRWPPPGRELTGWGLDAATLVRGAPLADLGLAAGAFAAASLALAVVGLAAAGAVTAGRWVRGEPLGPWARVAAATMAVGLGLAAVSGKAFQPHYLGTLLWLAPLPSALLLAAAARRSAAGERLVLVFLLAWALAGTHATRTVLRDVDASTSLATERRLVARIAAAELGPFELELVGLRASSAFAYRVLAEDVLGVPWPERAGAAVQVFVLAPELAGDPRLDELRRVTRPIGTVEGVEIRVAG